MRYQVKLGDRDSAPIALVLHGIEAQTPEEALVIAKRWLEDIADWIDERCSGEEETVEVLLNPETLVLTQVVPDESPTENQDDDEWEDDDDAEEDDDDEDDEWIDDDEETLDDGTEHEGTKHDYHDAVTMYERGLQALQRRDFAAAAEVFRNVIARYPEHDMVIERARLYLQVCNREGSDPQSDKDKR
jgi:TolA-binding protein